MLTPNGPTSKGGEEEVGGWEGKRVGKGVERVEIGDGKGGEGGMGKEGKGRGDGRGKGRTSVPSNKNL